MRANSPLPDSFSVLNPVEDSPTISEPTAEMKQLARAAKSPDGKIILDHLQSKIAEYTSVLLSTDFSQSNDNIVALATVISLQKMIKEFEAVLSDVTISTEVVKDAAKNRTQRA